MSIFYSSADSPDEDELSESTKINQDARKHIYTTVYHLMCTYWVVVVVGAFLLVMLTGAPSALKSIYLIFFFVFMITYQVIQMTGVKLILNCVAGITEIFTFCVRVSQSPWLRVFKSQKFCHEICSM